MRPFLKSLLRVLGVIVGVFAFVMFVSLCYSNATLKASEIIGFAPSVFVEKADAPFFYSIDGALKSSDRIDPSATTLVDGVRGDVVPAPDNRHVLAVANDTLFLIRADNSIKRTIAPVNSIYREPKPIGERFVRDGDFQWSRDSRRVYYIKDEYYESRGSQLFSPKAVLWSLAVATGVSSKMVAPFRAGDFAVGINGGIYFSVPDSVGDMAPKYFDGDSVRDLPMLPRGVDHLAHRAIVGTDTPFFSYSSLLEREDFVERKGVRIVGGRREKVTQQLMFGTTALLEISAGTGYKGTYHCVSLSGSTLLPGDRYLVVDAGCGNYGGQLLIDVTTGKYRTLPAKTKVYPLANTTLYPPTRPDTTSSVKRSPS